MVHTLYTVWYTIESKPQRPLNKAFFDFFNRIRYLTLLIDTIHPNRNLTFPIVFLVVVVVPFIRTYRTYYRTYYYRNYRHTNCSYSINSIKLIESLEFYLKIRFTDKQLKSYYVYIVI